MQYIQVGHTASFSIILAHQFRNHLPNTLQNLPIAFALACRVACTCCSLITASKKARQLPQVPQPYGLPAFTPRCTPQLKSTCFHCLPCRCTDGLSGLPKIQVTMSQCCGSCTRKGRTQQIRKILDLSKSQLKPLIEN